MAKKSSRIQELREINELSCMWGLFTILESCQGHPRHHLISNGRRVNEHITDFPRKLDGIASFDEECRRIQNEGDVPVDARAKTLGSFNQENMPIDKHESKRNIVKRWGHAKMDCELDRVAKTLKRERKSSKKAYQSSSCCLNNAGSLIHQVPSTSAEISLNKITLAAILEAAVCAQNHPEESHLGKYDRVDELNIQQIQMRAKAFVDQMFIDRKFICKEGMSSESKCFSDALEVLNLNEGILPRSIKNVYPSQTVKETVKSILDANFSEREGLDASSPTEPQRALPMKKRNVNRNLWQKSDKIVILKPAGRNAKHSENVLSRCSSLQAHNKSGGRVSDAKTTSFSFKEMKRKLKHTFGVSRKEQSRFSMVGTTDKLSQDRSTLRVGDECICGGVDIRNSFNSSTNSEQKRKLWKKKDLKFNRGSDTACVADAARKKLDYSSVRFSNKKEFDVILEAKRHLSTRLRNLNTVEEVTSKKSPKTLQRILSSPEHDFWPLSPRRESQYCSGSAQMRFSPYNTPFRATECSSQVSNGRESTRLCPLRSNTEDTSCDDHVKYDCTLKTCSRTPSTEEEVHDSDISTTDDMKSNGESNVHEMNNILQPELHVSGEVPIEIKGSNITRMTQINDAIKLRKDDEIAKHSTQSDSLSENEAITSAVDFSIYQLDMANSIKYQEEHRSPVSVLEPFFIEDSDSPPSTMLETARKQLQPRRLDFEECSFESIPHDPSMSANSCIEEDHLTHYVQLVVQASCLNWDQLSQMRSPPEELLHESLFDEVELPPLDCYYDPKLLFDHIIEVLLEIYKFHFCSPPWLAFKMPRIRSKPLAEVVLDEIMTEAEFYLLPTTEKRTLDQLVSKDSAKCRSWLDVRQDTERIVIDISEDVLEESMLDIVLEFTL